MNRQKKLELLKQEYQQVDVPDAALEALQNGIRRAKEEQQGVTASNRNRRQAKRKWIGKPLVQIVVAASVMALLIVPNANPQIAMAVADVPVLNKVVELVTVHRYQEEAADENYAANVETPELTAQGDAVLQSSVGKVNAEVQTYADAMIAQFQQELQKQGGVYALDITYHVVTDTDDWFTLQISTTETMASGAETLHYYNLDKNSGTYAALADVFPADTDYVTAISENIKAQMAERMEADENAVYNINCELPEDNFEQIAADQNFYINQDGQLVIVFNEYEAAPGFMGCPEFVIDETVIAELQNR